MFLMIIIQRKHDLLNYLWMIVRISPTPNSTPCLVCTLARGSTRYIQCDSVMKNSDCGLRLSMFKSRFFTDRQWEPIHLSLFKPSVTRGNGSTYFKWNRIYKYINIYQVLSKMSGTQSKVLITASVIIAIIRANTSNEHYMCS